MAQTRQNGLFQLQTLSNKVDEKIDSVAEAIKTLNEDTRAIHQRITTAEERISTLEDTLEATTNQAKRNDKTIQQLLQKTDDLENRSRRHNLRLTSISEGLEGNRVVPFVGNLLCYILDKTDAPPDVERAHLGRTSLFGLPGLLS